jgi:hypothetical protein
MSITDQQLERMAAQGFLVRGELYRQLCAELLAARARITELEAGLNWLQKHCLCIDAMTPDRGYGVPIEPFIAIINAIEQRHKEGISDIQQRTASVLAQMDAERREKDENINGLKLALKETQAMLRERDAAEKEGKP